MLHAEILKLDKLDSSSSSDMKKLANSIIKSKLPFNDLLLQCGMSLYLNRQDLLGENSKFPPSLKKPLLSLHNHRLHDERGP
jgi:hypothetical protein